MRVRVLPLYGTAESALTRHGRLVIRKAGGYLTFIRLVPQKARLVEQVEHGDGWQYEQSFREIRVSLSSVVEKYGGYLEIAFEEAGHEDASE